MRNLSIGNHGLGLQPASPVQVSAQNPRVAQAAGASTSGAGASIPPSRRRPRDESPDEAESSRHVRPRSSLPLTGVRDATFRVWDTTSALVRDAGNRFKKQIRGSETPILPDDLFEKIIATAIESLPSSDIYNTYAQAHTLSRVSKSFNTAVSGNARYKSLRRTVDSANQLFKEIEDLRPQLWQARDRLPQLLPALSPAHRTQLVTAATTLNHNQRKSDVFQVLSAQAAHLKSRDVEAICNAAIKLRNRMEKRRPTERINVPGWMVDSATDIGVMGLTAAAFAADIAIENALTRTFGRRRDGKYWLHAFSQLEGMLFVGFFGAAGRLLMRLSQLRVPNLPRPNLANLFAPASVNSHSVEYPGSTMFGMMSKMFNEMDARQRNRLIAAILSSRDEVERSSALASLGPITSQLTPAQRRRVITAATVIAGPRERVRALAGLCAGIPDLPEELRNLLVSALIRVFEVPDDCPPAEVAFASLALMLRHLTGEQKERIVNAATKLRPPSQLVEALEGLVVAMGELTDDQRRRLLNSGLNNVPPQFVAPAVIALAAGMPHFDDQNFDRLIHSLRTMDHPMQALAAIKVSASEMAKLRGDRSQRLVSAALDLQTSYARKKALVALARQIVHLDAADGNRIIQAATGLHVARDRCEVLSVLAPEAPQSVFDHIRALPAQVRHEALAPLATRLSSLYDYQRQDLIKDILATGDQYKADLLAALGPNVDHLTREERDAVLAAAMELPDEAHMMCALVGLRALAGDLTDQQFARLEQVVAAAVSGQRQPHLTQLSELVPYLTQLNELMPYLSVDRCARLLTAFSPLPQ